MSPEAVHHRPIALAHQFEDLEQQEEVATLGMWVFLATEVLFFGGLFATYLVYRHWHPGAFPAGSCGSPTLPPRGGPRRKPGLAPVGRYDEHGRAHHEQPDDGACGPGGADGAAP